jgi:hypothetical protein
MLWAAMQIDADVTPVVVQATPGHRVADTDDAPIPTTLDAAGPPICCRRSRHAPGLAPKLRVTVEHLRLRAPGLGAHVTASHESYARFAPRCDRLRLSTGSSKA